jgi:hypothetical protein
MADLTRVICYTLIPVGPRQADRTRQKLALLAVAGTDDVASTDGADPERFKPWTWQIGVTDPPSGDVRISVEARWPGGSLGGMGVVDATLRLPQQLAAGMLEEVKLLLARDSDLHLRTEIPVEGAQQVKPTLAEQLAYLAGTLGAVPQQLGIRRYLAVSFSAPVPDHAIYYAVPELDGLSPSKPVEHPKAELRWSYAPSGTKARSFGWKPRASHAEGNLGPDLATHWIRVGKREVRPWSDDLVERCRDATHLFARVRDCLRRFPATEELTRHLSIVGLSCYGSAEPQQRLDALAKVSNTHPPELLQPVDWGSVIQAGLALASTESTVLLELDKEVAEDALTWLWRDAKDVVKSALRDGESPDARGSAAAHRDAADQLVQQLVRVELAERREALTSEYLGGLLARACEPIPVRAELRCALTTYLATHWEAYRKAYTRELWSTGAATKAPPVREQRVTGLGVELDEVRGGAVADEELWDQLAGVGVLIRRRPRGGDWGPWRVLDVARVELDIGNADWRELFAGNPAERLALLPVRLPVRDGLRHPFLVYDHKSLLATSPLDDQIAGCLMRQTVDLEPGVEAKLRYLESVVTANPQDSVRAALLPPLKFGDAYQLAAFAIDLAGGMPDEITEPGTPWRHRSLEPVPSVPPRGAFGLAPDSVPEAACTDPLTYKRRVPIGALRVARVSLSNKPDIPDDVRPLARELEDDAPKTATDPEHRSDPLLVCPHSDDRVLLELEVSLPAVDIDLLERSIGIQAAKPSRMQWLEKLHVPAKARHVPTAAIETAFVDPAIRAITLRLERRDLDAAGAPWASIATDVIAATALTAAAHTERRLHVAARFAKGGEAADIAPWPRSSGPGRTFILPAGDEPAVFRISFEITDIDTSVFEPEDVAPENSYRVVIERASPLLPSETELHAWFQVAPVVDAHGVPMRMAGASLEPPASEVARFRAVVRNLATAEVLRHPWRWLGRPRPRWLQNGPECVGAPWPAHPAVVDRANPDVQRWEETAFIDLDPTGQAVPAETRRLPVGRIPLLASAHVAPTVPLLLDDRTDTVAAQYIRYGLRVTSRYAQMYKLDAVEAAEVRGRVRYVGWRAIYLPAQLASIPSPPVVLAALPLTRESDDDDEVDIDTPSGVLVVLDEIAFQSCGISEGIVAEIKVTPDHSKLEVPTHPAVPVPVRPEYGRSTINTNDVWNKAAWDAQTASQRLLHLDGPYGFTLEPASPEPRFTSSAYVLRPPFLSGGNTSDKKPNCDDRVGHGDGRYPSDASSRAWDMMRVRFQRVTSDHSTHAPSDSPTAWTKPLWLQLGANGKALTPRAPRLANGELSGLPVIPEGDPPAARAFYAAVTRSIVNVQGGTRDELYVGIAAIEDGCAQIKVPNLDATVTLHVRILEVQRAKSTGPTAINFPPGEALWRELFPKDLDAGPAEPRLRIVRVSPRKTIAR